MKVLMQYRKNAWICRQKNTNPQNIASSCEAGTIIAHKVELRLMIILKKYACAYRMYVRS